MDEKLVKKYLAQLAMERKRIIRDISLTEAYIALYKEEETPKRVIKRLEQLQDRLLEISL